MRGVLVAVGLIAAMAAARFMPHPPNFTPVMSVALFGSAVFLNRYIGIALATAAMLLSDAIMGLHSTLPFVYGSMAIAGVMGFMLRENRSPLRVLSVTLAGSVVFFLVTNLGVFLMQDMYPRTASGLIACYAMAIPFFKNSLAGDLAFSVVLFGSHFFLVDRAQRKEFPHAV